MLHVSLVLNLNNIISFDAHYFDDSKYNTWVGTDYKLRIIVCSIKLLYKYDIIVIT